MWPEATGNGRRAAVFDPQGNRLAGDELTLAAADRTAALAGKTVLQVAKDQTQLAAPASNGNVLAVTQSGAVTSYQPGSEPLFWPVVVTLAVGLFGLVVGRLTARRAEPTGPPAYPASPPPPPAPVSYEPPPAAKPQVPQSGPRVAPPSPPPSGGLGVDELARKYLQLVDTANSAAIYQEAVNALRSAGLTVVDPVGQQFDPSIHVAVGRRATGDPRSHNVVAETIRVGCYGDGRVVREAEVVVYRTDTGEQPWPR